MTVVAFPTGGGQKWVGSGTFAAPTGGPGRVVGAEKYETDWESPSPVQTGAGASWTFTAPKGAATDGTRKRRSEVWLAVAGGGVRAGEGDLVILDAYFTATLGPAGQETTSGNWHCLAQMHGPPKVDTGGAWNPAAFLLAAQQKRWWLHGGDGHPLHATEGGYVWDVDLGPLVDGQRTRFRVEALLSEDPAKGWVSVARDGRTVLDRWQPVGGGISGTGKQPGTLPNKAWVANRVGLYRGTDTGATLPSVDQSCRVEVFRSHHASTVM